MNHLKTLALVAAFAFWAGPALAAGMAATTGSCAQNACESPPKIILTSVVGG